MNNPFLAIVTNHLWQSTLFAAAIWGLTLLLRRNSARVRYALWFAASMKFLLPFAALALLGTLVSSHPNEGDSLAVTPRVLAAAGDIAAPLPVEFPYPGVAIRSETGSLLRTTIVVFFIWLAGAAIVAGIRLRRRISIWRAVRRSSAAQGFDFPIPVHVTDKQFEPGVVGVFRPKLLLPTGIEQRLTPEQMRAVLAHERCHVHRRDNLTASLHMRVETLLWFFPPIWWIGTRLIEEREKACDEQVVREGHEPERYAEGILNVCEHYIASRLPSVSGVSGADLRKRIQAIVKRTIGVKLDGRRKFALAGVACLMVAAPITAGIVSDNPLQLLLGTRTAALESYFQVSTASVMAAMAGRSGTNFAAFTCRDPGASALVTRRQKALAALAAKLPATYEKALLYAVAANSQREARRLLAAGSPRNGDGFMHPDSLMHIAATFGDVQMLELLANAGISINERNTRSLAPTGGTPLMSAISAGRMGNVRWLVEHGADASATDKYGSSALLLAMVDCRDRNLVSLLLQAGAKPNLKALRVADNTGFDLRTDAAMTGPPLQSWRPQPQGTEISADFDGDGKLDRASLRLSLDGMWEGVFVSLSSQNPGEWIKAADVKSREHRDAAAMAIAAAKPGTYDKACAKGHGSPCAAGAPKAVTLAHPGIEFYMPESASSIIYWDAGKKGFQRVWISD